MAALAFPDDGGHRRRQLLQGRGGLFRPVFLDKTQHHAGQHNGQNDPGIQLSPKTRRSPWPPAGWRSRDWRTGAAGCQAEFFARRQFVGAVALQALRRRLAQPWGRWPTSQRPLRRERMEMDGFRWHNQALMCPVITVLPVQPSFCRPRRPVRPVFLVNPGRRRPARWPGSPRRPDLSQRKETTVATIRMTIKRLAIAAEDHQGDFLPAASSLGP